MSYEEEWRAIPDHPDYEVSESGRVRSNFTGREKVPHVNHHGYWQVSLQVNKKPKQVRVHRLVAFAFVGGPRGPIVRHLDGDQQNNHYTNLAWGTQRENWYDSERHGTAYIRPRQEFCTRGHRIEDNLYEGASDATTIRHCRACWTTYNRTQLERRRAYAEGTLVPARICDTDGCERAHYAKGLCRNHYRSEFDNQKERRRAVRATQSAHMNAARAGYMDAVSRAGSGVLSDQDAYKNA